MSEVVCGCGRPRWSRGDWPSASVFRFLSRGLVLAIPWLYGCGETESGPYPDQTTSETPTSSTPDCPAGQVLGLHDVCVPVGIQDCHQDHDLDADGLCRPHAGKCGPGELPSIAGGCVPTGITSCGPEMLEDGICVPRQDACAPGELPLPQGCRDVADECVTLADLSDIDVFVEATTPPGSGTGTLDNPYSTIAEAIAHAKENGLNRIGVGAGVYLEPVHLDADLHIIGACRDLVTIAGSMAVPEGQATIWFDHTTDASVENVRVEPSGFGVFSDESIAELVRVHVEGASDVAVFVRGDGSHMTVRESLLEDTHATGGFTLADTGLPLGSSIYQVDGSIVDVEDSALLRAETIAIVAIFGGEAHLTSSTVADTMVEPGSGAWGFGLLAVNDFISVTESAFVRNREYALQIVSGSSLEMRHAVVADTAHDQGAQDFGWGIGVLCGADAKIEDTVVARNYDVGIGVSGSPSQCPDTMSTAIAERTLILDGGPARGVACKGCSGRGVVAQHGADIKLNDSAIIGNQEVGLYAIGDAAAHLDHVLVAGTRPSLYPGFEGELGRAVGVENGASADVWSSALVDNRDAAVFVGGAGSSLDLQNTYIADTEPQAADQLYGGGITLQDGATGTLKGNAIVRNHYVGLFLYGPGTTATSTGDYIAHTEPEVMTQLFGHGVVVDAGTDLESMSGAVLRRNTAIGFIVSDANGNNRPKTHASLSASLIDGTRTGKVQFLSSGSPVLDVGEGLRAQRVTLDVSGVEVRGNDGCGVLYIEADGQVSGLLATDNAEGCNFPVPVKPPEPTVAPDVVPQPEPPPPSCLVECAGLAQTAPPAPSGPGK